MTISQVAEIYDLTADTLRYYEKIGLIHPVKRNSSGIRDYDEGDCNWIGFIKCMRSAGLSIESLLEYVRLISLGDKTIEQRRILLLEQKKQLEEKMDKLKETMEILDKKIANYASLGK